MSSKSPLFLSLLLIACQTPSPSPSPSPSATSVPTQSTCSFTKLNTLDWQSVSENGFSFKLPPTYRKVEVQGIDSQVGRWEASATQFISFDHGGFSSTLDEGRELLSDYSECRLNHAAGRARVVSGFDSTGRWESAGPKYVVAGAWRDIKPGLHLSFSTTAANAESTDLLYNILDSVRFSP